MTTHVGIGSMTTHGGGGHLEINDQGNALSLRVLFQDFLRDELLVTGRGGEEQVVTGRGSEEQRGGSWHRSRMQS